VNSGGKHYTAPSTITNASSTRDLTRHHSDEDDDPEIDVTDVDPTIGGGQRGAAFANVVQLKRSPAELALFINFAIHHSDPSSSVSFYGTDLKVIFFSSFI
jgi:hypothetical protein